MKNTTVGMMMFFAVGFSACNSTTTEQDHVTKTQKAPAMNNLVSIVEISTTDFSRAVKFYQTILSVSIEEVDMGETKMGVLSSDNGTVSVCLVKGNDYKPAKDGTVIYLNAGKDLQPLLDKVAQHGGQVIVPKTEISPEMGFFALFIDTEGNKIGLHSNS